MEFLVCLKKNERSFHSLFRKIEKISAGEAMKYAVTGGVVDFEEEKNKEEA